MELLHRKPVLYWGKLSRTVYYYSRLGTIAQFSYDELDFMNQILVFQPHLVVRGWINKNMISHGIVIRCCMPLC